MNLKDSSTQKPSVSQDSDYFYEYLDYQQDNTSASPSSGASTVSVPTQTVKIIQPPQTQKVQQNQQKNSTFPIKKHPMIPPSPSSSGFTFFGVPLPSLNFNLWGHSGRKADRKESSSSGRPGRGRYRFFPPTEPEIHRGGFVPLPRAQSGFVPIADPRLTYEKRAKHENTTGSLNASDTVVQERAKKSGNSTVTKVEKITVPKTTNKSRTESRDREELSTKSTLDRSAVLMNSFESHKISPDVEKIR